MSAISSSAIATVNVKRFSIRAQRNMGKRGGGATGGGAPAATGSGGRSNLYQQMYHNGVRNA
ncbi:unnamed protein product, partial [Rotaria magnacalcarata]